MVELSPFDQIAVWLEIPVTTISEAITDDPETSKIVPLL